MSAYPHILIKRAQGNVVEWKRITHSSVWLCLPRCALQGFFYSIARSADPALRVKEREKIILPYTCTGKISTARLLAEAPSHAMSCAVRCKYIQYRTLRTSYPILCRSLESASQPARLAQAALLMEIHFN
jgi:hypothetical protein